MTQAQVGSNAPFVLGAGGNTLNGISSMALDDANIGTTSTFPFKIYRLVQQPESDPTSIYNEVLVVINNLSLHRPWRGAVSLCLGVPDNAYHPWQ